MKRSLVLSTNAFRPLIEVARRAEATGLHRIWTTESTPRDALVRAVTLGLHTERIGVATGIAYAFTRAPLAMAASAADAHIATGGRFALGVGAGTKGMRTRRYGVHDFDHPGPRLADYVAVMRAAWAATDGLRHEGPFYRADVPTPLAGDELRGLPPLRVFGSGVNRRMLADASASCDGVALHPLVSYLPYLDGVALPAMTGARPGARPGRERPWLAAWRITSVHEDEASARARARRNLAFYFTTPSYAPVVEGGPWEAPVAEVRRRFRARPGTSMDELAECLPEPMVDEFCLVATPGELPVRVRRLEGELAARGVDELVFQVAGTGLGAAEFVRGCGSLLDALGTGR
ncbi:LLM class flavin-dependent oxidoreductase [Pseudonocardia acaciae]|uniref:LLM class flavin-dependent oxidoreductase n=1 Tax=Pseudonocardia acaciae TaxID=551276 RepID=UPI00048D0A5A|nr:LLM class flavin-dependent oxidoreductase [Pseudonocardia acaciae]